MAKTVATEVSVDACIAALPDTERRADCPTLIAMMSRATGHPARMWGPGIIGFDRYAYTYDTGHSGRASRAFLPLSCALPNLGIYLPNMGKTAASKGSSAPRPRTGLAEALFTASQRRVLGLLFGQPDRSFFTKELIDLSGIGTGTVQRELMKLLDSGLVLQSVRGNQKHYRANPDAPIYDALVDIVQKTMGVAAAVQSALLSISDEVRFAILYGSVAKGLDRAQSDIDVLIVSDTLSLDRVFKALDPAEQSMGRTISPTVYTSEEFNRRRSNSNAFLTRVLDGPHVVLLGAEDAVGA